MYGLGSLMKTVHHIQNRTLQTAAPLRSSREHTYKRASHLPTLSIRALALSNPNICASHRNAQIDSSVSFGLTALKHQQGNRRKSGRADKGPFTK